MDLHERRQLDRAELVTRARARARPWRSLLALLVAVAGGIAAESVKIDDRIGTASLPAHSGVDRLIWICGLAALAVFGVSAVIGLSAQARRSLQPLLGQAHAGIVRYVLLLAGLLTVLAFLLSIYGENPDKWLLGGAVTGVLLGIAAQQSLGNLFAGLVLLFARPFRVGDHVRFRAGALSGEIDGVVVDLSLTYVRLQTPEGRMLLPNAQALAAAVLILPDSGAEFAPGSASADGQPASGSAEPRDGESESAA
jgi:small-conductance mechanosensitive channel